MGSLRRLLAATSRRGLANRVVSRASPGSWRACRHIRCSPTAVHRWLVILVLSGCAFEPEPWPEGCTVVAGSDAARRSFIQRVDVVLVVDPSALPDRERIIESAMRFLETQSARDSARFDIGLSVIGATLGGDAPGCDLPTERGLSMHGPSRFVVDRRVPNPAPPLDELRAFLTAGVDDVLSRRCEYSEPFGALALAFERGVMQRSAVDAFVFTRRDDCTRAGDDLARDVTPLEWCARTDLVETPDAIASTLDALMPPRSSVTLVAGFPPETLFQAIMDPMVVPPSSAVGCVDGAAEAFGARRLAQVGAALVAARHRPVPYSVCDASWERVFDVLGDDLAQLLYAEHYFHGALPERNGEGLIDEYQLVEELVEPRMDCAGLAGREPVPIRFEDDRPVCRIRQLVGTPPYPVEPGWYFYDGPELNAFWGTNTIVFTTAFAVDVRGRVVLEHLRVADECL
jgi:hypothetical protein